MEEPAGVTGEFWAKLAEQGWLGLIYRVDPADGATEALARCHGLSPEQAEQVFPGGELPALAYWVTAVRELFVARTTRRGVHHT